MKEQLSTTTHAHSPITAEVLNNEPVGTHLLSLKLGDKAYYGGYFTGLHPTVIEPTMLFVATPLRGQGIGERLVRRLSAEAYERDIKMMSGTISSPYALAIRGRIFGPAALRFFHSDIDRPIDDYPEQHAELPITFDQAWQSLMQSTVHQDTLGMATFTFRVEVDLDPVDWSAPEWAATFSDMSQVALRAS